jgi:hypothetical protein
MARTHKRPPSAAPPAARPDLSDWQGFRAQRGSSRMRWLAIAAAVAVVGTIALAGFKAVVTPLGFDACIFSLVALQVLVVVEADANLRGWARRAAPVACAFAVSAFAALALGASTGAAFGLCAAMLAVAVMPPSWRDWLLRPSHPQ